MGQENKLLTPFSLSALEKLADIIAAHHTGSGITELFRKAGFPEIRHDGSTKRWFVKRALEQIHQQPYGPYNVLKVVEALCNPEEFIGAPQIQEQLLEKVNQILGFYALSVGADGKVRRTSGAETVLTVRQAEGRRFDERGFHSEIRKHARQLFCEGHYFHAVLECCKALEKYVREKSGIDKHGADLMGAALNLTHGPLKVNTQRTESERNQQEGVMHLCIGLMRAIRNPASHEPALDWVITREDALDLLSLISYLFRQIDRAVCFKLGTEGERG